MYAGGCHDDGASVDGWSDPDAGGCHDDGASVDGWSDPDACGCHPWVLDGSPVGWSVPDSGC